MKKSNTVFNDSYVGQRPDILKLLPHTLKRVLDIGCSTGVLGKAIKEKTGATVVGVETSKEMAVIAFKKIDQVIVGDIEDISIQKRLKGQKFDAIIFADVLEHLRDPWDLLHKMSAYLGSNGVVIASIPNVRHIDTLVNLIFKGYWPYRTRGIHDAAHLRFFTIQNINGMFKAANLKIEKVDVHYRIIESPHPLNQYAKYFAFPALKEFLAFQYLIVAQKK